MASCWRTPAATSSGASKSLISYAAHRNCSRVSIPRAWVRASMSGRCAAAGRGRRHYPFQLSRHDSAVDAGARHRRRKCLHPQALGTHPVGGRGTGRAAAGSRCAGRHPECPARRSRNGRGHPGRACHPGGELCRVIRCRPARLRHRRGGRQARSGHGGCQEPCPGAARCGPGAGRRSHYRGGLWFGRGALHGATRARGRR